MDERFIAVNERERKDGVQWDSSRMSTDTDRYGFLVDRKVSKATRFVVEADDVDDTFDLDGGQLCRFWSDFRRCGQRRSLRPGNDCRQQQQGHESGDSAARVGGVMIRSAHNKTDVFVFIW
jgi:hypothetical protein